MNLIEWISQPWHWSFSGAMLVVVMFLLMFLGKKFGVSSSFEAMCSLGGAGKYIDYYRQNWRERDWLLLFVAGSIIGGFIASNFLASPEPVQLSAATVADLEALNISTPQTTSDAAGYLPIELFSWESLGTLNGIILLIVGGFLIGFGTRWAGGCTSGHAITGLSNFQLPSLIAVVGFFIGGLFVTHILFPILFV